jgi:hypothetical protein
MLQEPSAGAEPPCVGHVPFAPNFELTIPVHVGAVPTPHEHEQVAGVFMGSTSTVVVCSDAGHADCDAGAAGANATNDQPPGAGSTHV